LFVFVGDIELLSQDAQPGCDSSTVTLLEALTIQKPEFIDDEGSVLQARSSPSSSISIV
jgi:hypothetical protein